MSIEKLIYSIGFCIIAICFFILCSTNYENEQSFTGKKVICTTTMLADAVYAIAKERISVITLMGAGIDPHVYRAREGDVHRIASADMLFFHGLHLEGKMGELFDGMHEYVSTINVSNALDKNVLRPAEVNGIYDPHIWHDVSLWISCVRYIAAMLSAHDPENASYYETNVNCYVQELEALDDWAKNLIRSIPTHTRVLVTAHDAFSYFGRAYGLEVVSLQGISTESDIGTTDIIALVHYIVQNKIPVMFVENSIPTRSVQAVQQSALFTYGWSIAVGDSLYSDSLGSKESDAATYIGMMKHNITQIVSGLTGMPVQ